jgi:hypothetical protein
MRLAAYLSAGYDGTVRLGPRALAGGGPAP